MKRVFCLLTLICLAVTALPIMGTAALASAKYYITVDITNQIVTVYRNGNTSESGIVRQMICSTGRSSTPTPTGTYSLPGKKYAQDRTEWYYFSEYNCYAKWATRITGGILFHSVLYSASKKGPTSASVNALGSQASHGCVRLRVDDAKWIAQNCAVGTKCKVFKSGARNEDLRGRLLSKSFVAGNETYNHFMGRSDDPAPTPTAAPVAKINLSRGKKGEQVAQLQTRLRALGYYGDAVDGKFGKSTKAAVCAFQAGAGLKKTGKVNNDLWDRIFADGAQTSALATLTEGWQGPVVVVLQQSLASLKMFSGAIDGNFGADTTAAVSLYQQCYNLPVTGQADTDLQIGAVQRAAEVKSQFGEAAYERVMSETPVTLATITAKRYTRLRSAPKRGKKLAKLMRGAQVKVLADGEKWAQVQFNGQAGYVERKFLSYFPGTEMTVSFQPAPTPTPEPTPSLPGVLAAPLEAAEGLVIDEAAPAPVAEAASEPAPTPAPIVEATPEPAPTPAPVVEATNEPISEPADPPIPEAEIADEQAARPEDATEESAEVPAEEPAEAPEEEPEPAVLPKYAVALEGGARLFAARDADAKPLAWLAEGEALEVLAIEGDWIAVALEGQAAWVAATEVALADALPEPVQPQAPAEPGAEAVEPGAEAVESERDGEADGNGLTVEDEALPAPPAEPGEMPGE